MFHVQKSDDWQPTASIENLRHRAKFIAEIRLFFQEKEVLEVETPLMCQAAATDIFIQPIPAQYSSASNNTFFLQTSPEYAMKRLLAAGSGSIYQICKAFRNDEIGRLHNPEFTMLEWYRLGFDHHDLMDEVDEFLQRILVCPAAEKITYQALFEKKLGIDPRASSISELIKCAELNKIQMDNELSRTLNLDDWLDLLMSHCIEPTIGFEKPVIIYDFPASKAALAKVKANVAERFEVYVKGMEIANGYHELLDPDIHVKRFTQDCLNRERLNYLKVPIDQKLIAALKAGMPPCAGVALGIDRLLMLKLGANNIKDIVSFTIDRA